MTAKVLSIFRRGGPADLEPIAEVSDEALLSRCATGDKAALGDLFDRHAARVRAFVSRLGSCDDAELDDVVQVTFETVYSIARRFDGRSEVRTWILGIARNVSRRQARTRLRQRRIAIELVKQPAPAADSADDRVQREQQVAKLRRALELLSPKLREVFVLVYVEGLSGAEAAQILNIKEGAIWKRLHDARKQIALELGAKP